MAPHVIAHARETPRAVTGYLERATVRAVERILASGGVAVLPTDTIYGLHCVASNIEAVARIRRLKGRGAAGGFILLVADCAMASTIVARWPGASRELLTRIWPAPLTAVLPARKGLPAVLAPRGTIAIRVPAHEGLRRLVEVLGEPIVSTSVNISGRAPMTRIALIRKAFPGLEGYCSRRGRSARLSSTIVDFTSRAPLLLRAGLYSWTAGS
jgi:L-threonylcarbamoyladenylate synthase